METTDTSAAALQQRLKALNQGAALNQSEMQVDQESSSIHSRNTQSLQPANLAVQRALFSMVKRGQVQEFRTLVTQENLDVASMVDEPKNFSQTLAFSACIVPDKDIAFEMLRVLVEEFGVDPLKEDTLKQTPMFYAAREGNSKIISLLVARGDVLNRADKYGQTPIYYSVREGNVSVTQQMIDLGADFDFPDQKKQRPIYYAILSDRYDMVKFLIEKGADLKVADKRN